MLVANSEERITHAVIGGEETMDFGISNNAEFFQILSSSLYSNQILAVVREVMCNAWDAHIESGKQDTPIYVSIKDNELIVRDYGTGIPKDKIKEVYGIYGQSTKRLNGQVTGGFGLGCKSPFAYQDHFEVTSWNQEEQGIYAMCRSSADSGGKPGITPIVFIPTEESGLQVKVMIKPHDVPAFRKYIKAVASNGEMLVKFQDASIGSDPTVLQVIPYSKAKHNFTILSWGITDMHSTVNVRYGNVIYPVEQQDAIKQEYAEVVRVLAGLSGGRRNNSLVLQAEPHSICVAPSREALSMQPKTLETLRKLMTDFRNVINSNRYTEVVNHQCNLAVQEVVAKVTTPSELWASGLFSKLSVPDFIQTVESAARCAVVTGCVAVKKSRLIPYAVKLIPEEYRGAAKQLYTQLSEGREKEEWYRDNVVIKLPMFMEKFAKDLPKPKFVVTSYRNSRLEDKYSSIYFHNVKEEALIKKAVILTCAPSTFRSRLDDWPENFTGHVFMVQAISRNNPGLDALRQALSARKDILFLDMTIKHPWEIKESIYQAVKRPKGIVKLSMALKGYIPKQGHDNLEDEDYIREPEYILETSRADHRIDAPIHNQLFSRFLKRFGHVGGITITSVSTDAYKAKGAKTFLDFAIDKTYKYLRNSKKVARYVSIRSTPNRYGIIRCVLENDDLCKEFGLYTEMSLDDHFYLDMFNCLPQDDPRIKELIEVFDKKTPPPFFKKITVLTKTDMFLKYLDVNAFSGLLRSALPENAEEKKQAIALLKEKLSKELP